MSTIDIKRLDEGSMLVIKVHPTDLIPLRKHIGKMINEEIMREARAMSATDNVHADVIADKYHCSLQYVYYVLKKNKVTITRKTRLSYGKEG